MMPGLQIIDGQAEGYSWELGGRHLVIGRHPGCDVVVVEGTISRQHARVIHRSEGCFVEDLGSANGTFLNGRRVRRPTLLHDRDRIQIAGTCFVFVDDDAHGEPGETTHMIPQVMAEREQPMDGLDRDTLREIDVAQALAGVGEARAQVKLQAVLEITRCLAASIDIDEIFARILESVFRVLPQADMAYILQYDADRDCLVPAAIKSREGDADAQFTLRHNAHRVARQVMTKGTAILKSDPPVQGAWSASDSVFDSRGSSFMCAPLLSPTQQPVGCLYVDTDDTALHFTAEDLDVLACLAILAGQSIENARLHGARYQALVETSVDGIIMVDDRGTIESLNPAAERIFGVESKALIGRNAACLLAAGTDETGESALAGLLEAVETGTLSAGQEFLGQRGDGVTLPIYLSVGTFTWDGQPRLTLNVHDLSAQRRAEEALQQSQDRMSRILQTGVVAIAFGDSQGRLFEANEAFLKLTGYTQQELRELKWSNLTAPGFEEIDEEALKSVQRSQPFGPYEKECVTRQGERVPVMISIAQLPGASDEHVAFVLDITERKRAERELKALNERLEQRVEQRTRSVRLHQAITEIANEAQSVEEAFGAALEQICRSMQWTSGHAWLVNNDAPGTLIDSGIWTSGSSKIRQVLRESGRQQQIDSGEGLAGRVIASGRTEWIEDLADIPDFPGRDAIRALPITSLMLVPVFLGKQVCGVLEFFSRKPMPRDPDLIKVMRNLGTQLGRVVERRWMQQELIEAVWTQQRLLGQELHDSLGQELTGMRMIADSLHWKLSQKELPESEKADTLRQLIGNAQAHTRQLSKGMFPVEIFEQGLMASLEDLAETVEQQCSTQCRFHCEEPVWIDGNDMATHLFRITQEALNNAVKHSHASRIDIWLKIVDERLTLIVQDDGVGITTENLDQLAGLGLRSMRYRANLIGAQLMIDQAPDCGTLVTCLLPEGVVRRHEV